MSKHAIRLMRLFCSRPKIVVPVLVQLVVATLNPTSRSHGGAITYTFVPERSAVRTSRAWGVPSAECPPPHIIRSLDGTLVDLRPDDPPVEFHLDACGPIIHPIEGTIEIAVDEETQTATILDVNTNRFQLQNKSGTIRDDGSLVFSFFPSFSENELGIPVVHDQTFFGAWGDVVIRVDDGILTFSVVNVIHDGSLSLDAMAIVPEPVRHSSLPIVFLAMLWSARCLRHRS